jgi:hypothetical protein
MTPDQRQILDTLLVADPTRPAEAIELAWPLLEHIRSRGGIVLVKLDGERRPGDGAYTVVISGHRILGDDSFRSDAVTLAKALHAALTRCPASIWM